MISLGLRGLKHSPVWESDCVPELLTIVTHVFELTCAVCSSYLGLWQRLHAQKQPRFQVGAQSSGPGVGPGRGLDPPPALLDQHGERCASRCPAGRFGSACAGRRAGETVRGGGGSSPQVGFCSPTDNIESRPPLGFTSFPLFSQASLLGSVWQLPEDWASWFGWSGQEGSGHTLNAPPRRSFSGYVLAALQADCWALVKGVK